MKHVRAVAKPHAADGLISKSCRGIELNESIKQNVETTESRKTILLES